MFGTDLLLLAGIADRESEESLADFDLGRISPELRPLAGRLGAAVVLVCVRRPTLFLLTSSCLRGIL